jgi:hypothetical protein
MRDIPLLAARVSQESDNASKAATDLAAPNLI